MSGFLITLIKVIKNEYPSREELQSASQLSLIKALSMTFSLNSPNLTFMGVIHWDVVLPNLNLNTT